MKVLATGSSGFLGRHVVESCRAAGFDVVPTSRTGDQVAFLDLSDTRSILRTLDDMRPDAIVNCAAVVDWGTGIADRLYPVNTLAPGVLAGWCRMNAAYMIQVSGSLVYGSREEAISIDSVEQPDTDYGRSKLLADRLVLASGAQSAIIRYCGLYGRNGPSHLGLNRAIADALKGTPPTIVGRGTAIRNYLYVKDAASLIVHFLDQRRTGVHLVASTEKVTVERMLTTLSEVFLGDRKPKYIEGKEARNQVVFASVELPVETSMRAAFEDMR